MKNKKWLIILIVAFPSMFWLILESSNINSRKLPYYGEKLLNKNGDTIYHKVSDLFYEKVNVDSSVNFKQEKIFILGTYNKKQETIKKFNCNKCSETLFIYYDIEKSQYFVNGERLEELRNAILEKKRGIGILKKKLVENINEQIKDFLQIKIIKEEEELNHLIQNEKELTKSAPKEDTQV